MFNSNLVATQHTPDFIERLLMHMFEACSALYSDAGYARECGELAEKEALLDALEVAEGRLHIAEELLIGPHCDNSYDSIIYCDVCGLHYDKEDPCLQH